MGPLWESLSVEAMKRVRLIKLSVCECGFSLLDESIPLGAEYTIEETNYGPFTLTCGG